MKFQCLYGGGGEMRKNLGMATLMQRQGTEQREISVLVPGP